MANQLVYKSNNSRVLIQENEEYGKHIVKILNDEYPPPQSVKQFLNEYEIVKDLDIKGIRKVFKWDKIKNHYSLHLEYVDGITLRDFSKKRPKLIDSIKIGISIAKTLSDIHSRNIIHKDISPGNILIDPKSLETIIIDFGISSKFNLKNQHLGNPEKLEGTISYISPEQTGRMNRFVDYRTDMYSLGIVLYELLTGKLPFESKDAMGLVHAHIAITPKPLTEYNHHVPSIVSDIVLKLLSKNAEDRYQSAYGLTSDLEHCIEQLEKHGRVDRFDLAQNDFSGKFQLIQKLYGRDNEIQFLIEAFDRISKGRSELILVAGYSGTGKSSLVQEIHKPVTEKRGYSIEGKYDQFQRAIPYFAMIQAFTSFIDLLLTENEWKLNYFKELIQEAVGEEGKVLTDVIPNLELIIGEQPEVPEIGGSEAQNRFNYVFRKFVTRISSRQHPIALFIDDLQWADSASLDLLLALMTDTDNQHFLCVGAYRDNEVGPTHPFITAVENMKAGGVKVSTITIGNLTHENVNDLISESLLMESSVTRSLTDLVMEKTGGNAFFVTQFLKSLYEEGLLYYDSEKRNWHWNIASIRDQNLTDNVVELMAGKILRMPEKTQQVLKLAACIGAGFDLSTLSFIYGKDEPEASKELEKAVSEGLVLIFEEHYRFAHDRIQQAVYSLIPESELNALHLKIGKLLLDRIPEDEQEDRLFDIVSQLNWGIDIIDDPKEREMLAELNLKAGLKAKDSSAYEPAFENFQCGIRLLKTDHWESQYPLSIQLFTEAAETAFLSSRFEEMNSYIDVVLQNSQHLIENIRPYEIRIQSIKAENRLPDALASGLELLEKLGEKFPKKPSTRGVLLDLGKTALMLRGKTNERIYDLPEMKDPFKRAAIQVLANIAPSSYWANPQIFPFIIFRLVQMSLKHGNAPVSAFGYATYGVIMTGAFNAIKTGYRFGKLGLSMLDKFKSKEWIAQVYTAVYALIVIWNEHIKNTLKPLQESYHIGLETGAIEFACVNANIYGIHSFLIGRPLEKLSREMEDYSKSFNQYKQGTNFNYNEVYRQAVLNFLGESKDPTILKGDAYDEVKMMHQNKQRKDRTGTFFIHFNKLILDNFFGNYEHAWDHAVEARMLLDAVLAKLEVAVLHFHEALAAAAIYEKASSGAQRKLKRRISANLKKMKNWAAHAPSNYQHKYELMYAESARIKGRISEAKDYYDKAIKHAEENGYLNEEALANEIAGKFYRDQGSIHLSDYHLKNAFQAYREWGAQAKLDHLQAQYPEVISNILIRKKRKSIGTGLSSVSPSTTITATLTDESILDLDTVLKASASISGEIVLGNLLRTMMSILLENLGATSGSLVLQEKDLLFVEAHLESGKEQEVLQKIPVVNSNLVPESLISYIKRTEEEVVLDHALEDARFAHDPYIQKNKPVSLLGFPIISKGVLIGILYFENNLAEGAFTEARMEMLSLLSGQIAISIENALLYESLEQKVIERTAQLAEEKKKSDALLLNILPEKTAEELKQFGKAKPRRFEKVSVMFTDFKDFTKITAKMRPEDLVEEIDTCFGEFDRIIQKHGIEKIKTIGDSYMCAGGLPEPGTGSPDKVIEAALEIRDYMKHYRSLRESEGRPYFAVRIGINTGPIVAGVVGSKKFAYDIWGDTVNTASRMESNCEPWEVNISGNTYEEVKDQFKCHHRGKVEVKNKGKIDMYYVVERISD
jgi:predicted ATPase/class 3 adenylate cyclase